MASHVFFLECLGLCCLRQLKPAIHGPHMYLEAALFGLMYDWGGRLPASSPYLLKVNSCCCERHITDMMKALVLDFSLSSCVFRDLKCWQDTVLLWWHLTLDFPVALYHWIKSWCAFVEKLTGKAAQRITSPFTRSVLYLNYQLHLFHLCQTRVQTSKPYLDNKLSLSLKNKEKL